MKQLLFYMLQMIITSGILYAYYHFALRNKKFHKYNRYYILSATLFSIAIPFLNIPVYFTTAENESSIFVQTLTSLSVGGARSTPGVTATATTHWFTWENILWIIYLAAIAILLFRMLYSLLKIRKIVRGNPGQTLEDIYFVNTNEPGTPFSFFRWLFWNRQIELHSDKGQQIFRHEVYHIKQKHSLDVLYMELLTIICWINPFFHLMKKELKAIHEFLADQFAVTENSRWQYAELLLMRVFNTNQSIVNPFFHNQIKRRIAMITTSNKPGHQYLRKMIVLPLAATLFALFAFSYHSKTKQKATHDTLKTTGINQGTDTVPAKKLSAIKEDLTSPTKDNGGTITVREVRAGENDLPKKDLELSSSLTEKRFDSLLFVLDGVVQTGIHSTQQLNTLLKPEEIHSVNVLKGEQAIAKYGKQAAKGVIEIWRKNSKDAVIELAPIKTDTKVFTQVEDPARFPGGDSTWRRFLSRNINAAVPVDAGAPAGRYKVIVQFVVLQDGSIADIKPVTALGYGMENEVIRLIKSGPNWIPATQNGRVVNSYVNQPVTFEVSEEKTVPTAPTNKLSTSEITLTELKKADPYKLLNLSGNIEIISYSFSIDNTNSDVFVMENKGSSFNEPTRDQIRNAKPGRFIILEKIKVRVDGAEKKLPAKLYKVIS